MSKRALMISCFDWYASRLRPIRGALMERGYEVIVLIADFDHLKKQRISPHLDECTYVSVKPYKSNLSVDRLISHFQFARGVGKELKRFQPDLVYVQVPPNSAGKTCARFKKRRPDAKMILDIIDLWPESMPLQRIKKTLPMRIWASWRTKSIEAADYVFTECDLYRKKLKDVMDPKKTSSLHLFKEQGIKEQDAVGMIVDGRKDDGKLVKFAYLGSMNHILDIDGICGIIRSFIEKGWRAELHAIGIGEKKEEFEKNVRELGCQTRFYGGIFDEMEKIKILAPCDYAFNMMKQEVEVGLTTKSIDYFSCGLPVINNIKGDTWVLVERERCGVNIREGVEPDWSGVLSHSEVWAFFKREFSIRSFLDIVQAALDQLGV